MTTDAIAILFERYVRGNAEALTALVAARDKVHREFVECPLDEWPDEDNCEYEDGEDDE